MTWRVAQVATDTSTTAHGHAAAAYGLVGESPAMATLAAYIPKVARSHATVLVTGETGTGKELVARAIHALSPRAAKPFVVINCGALPDSLIESELFGHTRGAFTGATGALRGKLIEADGGTLFLDEIGEMSLYAQARLLRVLETHEVQPLGGGAAQRIDIRVVAATNRELDGEVAAQRFRADLFYRLNVARLVIPPLRDRPDDVALLARHVIDEFNHRDNAEVAGPDADLLAAMMAYDWPGNVRELRNVIEAVFIDPPSGPMRFEHLPSTFQAQFARYRHTTPATERSRLIDALERTNWNKAEAAKALNWSRMTLYRKLVKYDVAGATKP
ncbi:MAG: sigma 54-interacting transcriptional regulator [Casimicrobiaceae bacterium]